jgi:dTDP-4-amino-4,6-dideoxygalactose transaminase
MPLCQSSSQIDQGPTKLQRLSKPLPSADKHTYSLARATRESGFIKSFLGKRLAMSTHTIIRETTPAVVRQITPPVLRRSTLAVDGGTPVRSVPFPSWPQFSPDEIEAAGAVLRSGKVNYWTGDEGRKFEQEYAAHIGVKHAIAVANGTVALELALYALGIGPGDDVIVTSRSFVASASCVVMRGARPVFADIDRDSQNLTAATIRRAWTPQTRAIIAVHLAGWPCDMDGILALAAEKGIAVIEDCAQAHGAIYKGRPVGSMGAINAFSFCQDKIISTGGEGGLITTNEESLWERAWSFKDHGKSYDAVYRRQHPPGYRWLHESLGTNWRLTEMQSAIGRVLLRELPQRTETRRRNAAILNEAFAKIPALRVTLPPPECNHAYYKYYVFVRSEKLRDGWTRDRVMQAITAEGIPCFSGYGEMYLEKAFSEEWRPSAPLTVAHELAQTSLMFVVHSTLSEEDMRDTCCAVEKVMDVAARPSRTLVGVSPRNGLSTATRSLASTIL